MPKRTHRDSWFTCGNFFERTCKELVLIGPVTFVLGFYYFYVRADQDASLTAYTLIALAVAAGISMYNASRTSDVTEPLEISAAQHTDTGPQGLENS